MSEPLRNIQVEKTEGRMKERMPLYHKEPGEAEPRGAYLEIDLETGEVRTGIWDPHVLPPSRVVNGLVQRVKLSPYTLKEALEEFLESEEVKGLVQQVLKGARVYWDGWARVGELTREASLALDEIWWLASDLPEGIVWKPKTRFRLVSRYDEKTGRFYVQGKPAIPENLEELFEQLPEEWEEKGKVHFAPGLHGYLREVAMGG